ncbi:hypothetical protein EP7_004335 [Isosphaeraceae bacterium EP7]
MAISTERTVRDVIVAAIKEIAADLGFSDPEGNVWDYPLIGHQKEQTSTYLMARVGNGRIARAWAVDVGGYDELFAMRQKPKRNYSISIIGYYAKGNGGVAYNTMKDHARLIRGAINRISPSLSGTVTELTSASPISISERDSEAGPLLEGVMTYGAVRTNPDF